MNRQGHATHGGNKDTLLEAARAQGWQGSAHSFIDASANLNPLGPPQFLNEVICAVYEKLTEYPDPSYSALCQAASKYHGTKEVRYIFGNGADELMFALARALKGSVRMNALIPSPSYSSYKEALEQAGFTVEETCLDSMLASCQEKHYGTVWLGAPNNPDGIFFPGYPVALRELASKKPETFFVVDEAFLDFTETPSLLDEGTLPHNICVIRSLTKIFAVPGLRIGYACFSNCTNARLTAKLATTNTSEPTTGLITEPITELDDRLRAELPNWPLNAIAEAFAYRTFTDPETQDYITTTRAFIDSERKRIREALDSLFRVPHANANFYLLAPPYAQHLKQRDSSGSSHNTPQPPKAHEKSVLSGEELRSYLLKHGIAARDCSNFPGLGPAWSRLAVRTSEENSRIIDTLRALAAEYNQEGNDTTHTTKQPAMRRAKALMIQGCTSSAGKSVLVSALCRIMRNRGIDVAPYKAQNMSNNSAVTHDGKEIGRAQAVQALAAGLLPDTRMNPILIKPEGDMSSQVIVNGLPWKRRTAAEYYQHKRELARAAEEAYDSLAAEHELVILEGAGSPGEINLKSADIVNMRAALYANADVYLVGDIDRGGVFASFIGHAMTFRQHERKLLKGFIVNKFRGDPKLLTPAYSLLQNYTNIPVIGCIPYFHDIVVPEEDESRLYNFEQSSEDLVPGAAQEGHIPGSDILRLGIIMLPHVSNFTDFEPFHAEPLVRLIRIYSVTDLDNLDAVIVPGSKTTMRDFAWLKETGLAERILHLAENGVLVFGICGGYQMLGIRILDPDHTESDTSCMDTLGLLPVSTIFSSKKSLTHGKYRWANKLWEENNTRGASNTEDWSIVNGYEIHHGVTELCLSEHTILRKPQPFIISSDGSVLGYCFETVMGTYLHGIFDNDDFRTAFLNKIRSKKNLKPQDQYLAPSVDAEIQKLAELVEANCDIDAMLNSLGL